MKYKLSIGIFMGTVGCSLLIGCGAEPIPQSSPVASPLASSTAVANRLAPGEHCFQLDSPTVSGEIRLTLQPDGAVTGTTNATIHDEAEAYYSSYMQDFEGTVEGDRLALDVVTQIENDTQNTSQTWTLADNALVTEQQTYTTVDCAALTADSSVTPDVPPGQTAPVFVEPTSPPPQRIEFAQGSIAAVVSNSVVRGTRDTYLVGASQGQTMKLDITSPEDNAVFDLIAPSGEAVFQETRSGEVTLPETGDYQVIVGGTRGNATYELAVEIN